MLALILLTITAALFVLDRYLAIKYRDEPEPELDEVEEETWHSRPRAGLFDEYRYEN